MFIKHCKLAGVLSLNMKTFRKSVNENTEEWIFLKLLEDLKQYVHAY